MGTGWSVTRKKGPMILFHTTQQGGNYACRVMCVPWCAIVLTKRAGANETGHGAATMYQNRFMVWRGPLAIKLAGVW